MNLKVLMTMTNESQNRSSIEYLKNSVDCSFNIDFNSLNQEDTTSLLASYHTVKMNFDSLRNEFVGNPNICPVFHAGRYDKKEVKAIEIKSKMDNYLSSVYSYNEHLRSILNRCIKSGHMGSSNFIFNDNVNRTSYSKKLELILGLRVVSQHGEYDAIDTKDVESNIDGAGYGKLVLGVQEFKNYNWREDDMGGKYLRNVHETEEINLMIRFNRFNRSFKKFNRACFYVLNEEKDKDYTEESELISEFNSAFNSF